MGTPADIEALLEPIDPDTPAGISLAYDPVCDTIREARKEDDASLPQGIWQSDLKKADWQRVRELCIETLRTRSKDLQVSAWLLEASMQLDGFAGLRHGLEAMVLLCERYWEELHPMPEDGDLEYRLSPLVWVNEKLGNRVRLLPVTQPTSGDTGNYSLADLDAAQRLDNHSRKNPRALSEAGPEAVTLADFNASTMLTPDAHFRAIDKELAGAERLLDRFHGFLSLRCGEDTPSLGRLRRAMEEVAELVRGVLRERLGPEANGREETGRQESVMIHESVNTADETPRIGITIRSRDEAYSILASVADYLMRVEPHSPAPYLVKRAVTWGGMSLSSLLVEMVGEGRDLMEIYKLLGINER